MLAILSLVQQLLSVGAGRKHSHISGINLNLTGIAAFFLGIAATIAAMVFLMVGLQGWLAMVINSPYAVPLSWLCCGVLAFAVAGISVLVAKDNKKKHSLVSLAYSPVKPAHHETIIAGLNGGAHAPHATGAAKSPFDETFIKAVTEEVAAKIEDHPLASVIIAGLAGVAAGKTIEKR